MKLFVVTSDNQNRQTTCSPLATTIQSTNLEDHRKSPSPIFHPSHVSNSANSWRKPFLEDCRSAILKTELDIKRQENKILSERLGTIYNLLDKSVTNADVVVGRSTRRNNAKKLSSFGNIRLKELVLQQQLRKIEDSSASERQRHLEQIKAFKAKVNRYFHLRL